MVSAKRKESLQLDDQIETRMVFTGRHEKIIPLSCENLADLPSALCSITKALEKAVDRYNAVTTSTQLIIYDTAGEDLSIEFKYYNLFHNWAHQSYPSHDLVDNQNAIINAFINQGRFHPTVFRLTSRLSYPHQLNQDLLEFLQELGIPTSQAANEATFEVPFDRNRSIQLYAGCLCCHEMLINSSYEDYFNISPKRDVIPIELLLRYIMNIVFVIFLLKRLTIEAIRLQYIANTIRNRISRSPTPNKKEPPVGGVKVGGKQYGVRRHVAEMLYPNQKLKSAA